MFYYITFGGCAENRWRRQSKKNGLQSGAAMIGGRAVWGLIQLALAGVQHTDFTMNIFLTRAVVDAIPGIILQLALIPPLVTALDVAGLTIRSKGEGS